MPQHPAPGPDVPPAADASGTIPTQTRQTAQAGEPAGSGLPDDAQPGWWALLACGHRVEVVQLSPGTPTAPAAVPCPRCRVDRRVDVYPLTALSDPDNVGWVPEDGTR